MRKRLVLNTLAAVMLTVCGFLASCVNGKGQVELKKVCGTMEGPLEEDTLPANVKEAMDKAVKFHQHEVMRDDANDVSVWSIGEIDQVASEGFGIVVVKGAKSTTFSQIRNAREPWAVYDSAAGDLWLTASVVWGTGVHVERLYRIRFQDDGTAYIAASIDPYEIQQTFCERLGYTTEGEQITLYIDQQPADTITNTVTDMGGFDEDALWVGEQISYDLSSGKPRVCVTPGVKFVTGLVLHYDDMPTLTAGITVDDKGAFTLSDIVVRKEDSFLSAIDRYLTDKIGKQYAEAEICVPFHTIIGADESNADDILVWGDFWVFNYNQVGDTLKTVSGGNHPGLFHVRKTETGFEVTSFDQVEDGAGNMESARKIFGEKFSDFQNVHSDDEAREQLRGDVLAEYVTKHNLSATMYQDQGWQAKELPH